MSFAHGKNSRVLINDQNLSARLNTWSAAFTRELSDSTMFGDDGHRFISGLVTGTLSLGGGFDEDIHEVKTNALGVNDSLIITVAPAGVAVGKPAIVSVNDPSSYTVESGVADMVTVSSETQSDDGIDFGHLYHTLTAETATGNSTNVDNVDATTNGGVATLHVTAVTGVTPTLDVKVQHSVDNSTWVDLVSFSQSTTVDAQRVTVSGTVNRHVRILWTIAGTSPNFTFTAAFARR